MEPKGKGVGVVGGLFYWLHEYGYEGSDFIVNETKATGVMMFRI